MRPSKIHDEATRKRLLDAIRAGNYYEAACGYANIDYKTFRTWILRGEEAEKNKDEAETEAPYRQFLHDLKKAEGEAETRIVALWQTQIPSDWKAAATFLERRYPKRWGRMDRLAANIEHSGQMGLHVRIDYGDGDDGEEEEANE